MRRSIYNNLDYDNTKWRVATKDSYNYDKYIKFKIKEIVIEQDLDNFDIYYIADNYEISEDDIFEDLDKALDKCKELNKLN